jgi:hypothetical protein
MQSLNRKRGGRTLAIAGSREGKLIYLSAHARMVTMGFISSWGLGGARDGGWATRVGCQQELSVDRI